MAKLNPPVIEGSIPAFTGTTIVVPFSMNRSVGRENVGGMHLKMKTVQSNSFLCELKSEDQELSINWANMTVTGNLAGYANKIRPGQFYKVQLAYISKKDGTVGYYSTVGVIKCAASNMEVGIQGLDFSKVNNFNYSFLGYYKHEDDPTERAYSYRFVIYDTNGIILKDSGTRFHVSDNDVSSTESCDEWECLEDLSSTMVSYIQYTVTTVNKIVLKTPKYKILHRNIMPMDAKIELIAELDFDNGYVRVNAQGVSGNDTSLTGGFLLTRSEKENPNAWVSIQKQNFQAVRPSEINFTDFTIEQGKTYTYALQQFNDMGLYSERVISNSIYADFEDMFLYDGKRQLKIRYNPKVSSFKIDVLESKTETIGSQYPFIFRNGAVYYREFPISGLISYQMDEEHLFMKLDDMRLVGDTRHRTQTEANAASFIQSGHHHSEKNAWGDDTIVAHIPTTSLTNYNTAAERWFKMKVLEWLNDGQPKLFRSPSEGNYIVRLMNSSLTPNDTVGRMLHTFQCTAYEIEKYDYNKLMSYGLTEMDDVVETLPSWKTIRVIDITPKENVSRPGRTELYNKYELLTEQAFEVLLQDFLPGDEITISFIPEDGNEEMEYDGVIGATGSYRIENIGLITQVSYWEPVGNTLYDCAGIVTIGYDKPVSNNFDMVEDIEIDEVRVKQVFGIYPYKDKDVARYTEANLLYEFTDRLQKSSDLTNTDFNKTEPWQFIEMKIEKREMGLLYYKESNPPVAEDYGMSVLSQNISQYFYLDSTGTEPVTELDSWILYKIVAIKDIGDSEARASFVKTEEQHSWDGAYIDGKKIDFYKHESNDPESDDFNKWVPDKSVYYLYSKEEYSAKVYIDYPESNFKGISPDKNTETGEIIKTAQQKLEEWASTDLKGDININNQVIDVSEIDEVVIREAFPQHNFYGSPGAVVTLAYMPRTLIYNLEETLINNDERKAWQAAVQEYTDAISSNRTPEHSDEKIKELYDKYLETLDNAMVEWLRENGRA